jgi:hypothetical protein
VLVPRRRQLQSHSEMSGVRFHSRLKMQILQAGKSVGVTLSFMVIC